MIKINPKTIPDSIRVIQIQRKFVSQNSWEYCATILTNSKYATRSICVQAILNILCFSIVSIDTNISNGNIYIVIRSNHNFSAYANSSRSCREVYQEFWIYQFVV